MEHADVCIAGAGLIGASLALELAARGQRVALFSDGEPLAHASTAAAGMLAVNDPENPPALHALSQFSRSLYPDFLEALHAQGAGELVRFQTGRTLQLLPSTHGARPDALTSAAVHALVPQLRPGDQTFALLDEASLDPRTLAHAIRAALANVSRIDVHRGARVISAIEHSDSVTVHTGGGEQLPAADFVDCTGAWSLPFAASCRVPVYPRKGQLLTVTLPAALPLDLVIRTAAIYIVPRLHGPQRGRAVIGATVEDRGFNTDVEPAVIADLRARAAALLPELAEAEIAETWAGLRPATADGLPVIGRSGHHTFIATGHYRNGILLAPATARVMADLIHRVVPAVDLAAFSPARVLPA